MGVCFDGSTQTKIHPELNMESISRISSLLESARELTLDAAAAARSSRSSSSKPVDRNQVKKLLDSRNEREVLDGLRRVISVCRTFS